jgi:hypothetical protein
MPMHDWTRVTAGTYHNFHFRWIAAIMDRLNETTWSVLPVEIRSLLERRSEPTYAAPRVWHRAETEVDIYAAKAKAVTVRHASNHRVIAIVEIVSPGNKSSRQSVGQFAEKAEEFLRAGIHLLIVDLFPPSVRDPQGIHKAIWDQFLDNDFTLPRDTPLTLAAYIGGPVPESFVNVTALGLTLPEMPLFLTPDEYVPLSLEATYQMAWDAVPAFWQNVLESPVGAHDSPAELPGVGV